jgi:hypothetical protein
MDLETNRLEFSLEMESNGQEYLDGAGCPMAAIFGLY